MNYHLIIAGALVGILVGLTGMGGGSLMTPILILIFKFNPITAIGTDILHGAIFKSFGAYRHYSLGTVKTKLVTWMALGSVPSSVAGVWVLGRLRASWDPTHFQSFITTALGSSLIIVGFILLVRLFYARKLHQALYPAEGEPFTGRNRLFAFLVGLSCGFVLGLTSVGSGVFIGLFLILLFKLRPREIVGTDVFHAAILLWASGIAHLISGNVELKSLGLLLIGSIPGVWFGSTWSAKMPDGPLRAAIACVLTLSGAKLLGAPNWLAISGLVISSLVITILLLRRIDKVPDDLISILPAPIPSAVDDTGLLIPSAKTLLDDPEGKGPKEFPSP